MSPDNDSESAQIPAIRPDYLLAVTLSNPGLMRRIKRMAYARNAAFTSADDLAQIAYMRVLMARDKHDPARGPIENFLVASIANAMNTHYRKELQHVRHHDWDLPTLHDAEQVEENERDVPDHRVDIDNEVWSREVGGHVRGWLHTLPPNLQQIYDLLYVRGLTQREAALSLGVSQVRVNQLNSDLLRQGKKALAYLKN